MRFLLCPNYALPYDQRMVRGLAQGLRSLGQDAHALNGPANEIALAEVCRDQGIDVVLQVNRLRSPDFPLPARVRHIAWFQDVFPSTVRGVGRRVLDNDLIYALGDADALGLNIDLPCFLGSLLTGVDESAFAAASWCRRDEINFSLCAFIPPPLVLKPDPVKDLAWLLHSMAARTIFMGHPFLVTPPPFSPLARFVPYALSTNLRDLVLSHYKPLHGDLDIHQLTHAMNDIVTLFVGSLKTRPPRAASRKSTGFAGLVLAPYRAALKRTAIDNLVSYMAREYPRLLDRVALVEGILGISRSLELWGPGWENHLPYKEFHKGVLSTRDELASVYRHSRINLANNTHGLGLHSRTLECMAVAGFIFVHSSPHDTKPGGMLTSFEPGVHYGMYTPDSLQEEAMRWLRNDAGRRAAAERAADVIREKHLWRHRAQQILDDLAQ